MWCKRAGGGYEQASTKRASHVKAYAVPATHGLATSSFVPNTTLFALTVRVTDPGFCIVAESVPVVPK